MPLMVWNQKLSVKITVIDDDHKKLLGLMNDLYDGIKARRGRLVLGPILDELLQYTQYHFSREEELFSSTGYEDTVRHKAQHDYLLQKIKEIQQQYGSGSQALTLEALTFLKDWLYGHIVVSDAKYAPHLNANGIS